MRLCLSLLLLAGCAQQVASTSCDFTCNELVTTCAYPAFPTRDTCLQGCAYWEESGVNVDSYLACVQDAACNTFQILECEHEFGVSSAQ